MIQVIMAAMGCDRRAHYGNVEQPFCGTHGHYGQWPCPDAARVAAALTAAGYGLVADAKREAWAEGYSAGFWDAKGSSEYRSIASNPYRKASNDDQ